MDRGESCLKGRDWCWRIVPNLEAGLSFLFRFCVVGTPRYNAPEVRGTILYHGGDDLHCAPDVHTQTSVRVLYLIIFLSFFLSYDSTALLISTPTMNFGTNFVCDSGSSKMRLGRALDT